MQYKEDVIRILRNILPRIAEGFSIQRGAMFRFGPHAEENTGSLLKISNVTDTAKEAKLLLTPVHNLSEERSVGSIGYEISIRGRNNLESASKKHLLNKSLDKLQDIDFTRISSFKKPLKEVNRIKLEWRKRQELEQIKKYSEKESVSFKIEASKYNLLEKLKKYECPGPFTTKEEVESYVSKDIADSIKNTRLYEEVKYARISSVSLQASSPLFRLKKAGKNLDTSEYAKNLMEYLDTARCCKTITTEDLKRVIANLSNKNNSANKSNGKHIISVWVEENIVSWYLGVVEEEVDDGFMVNYFIRDDSAGKSWKYPECVQSRKTVNKQILLFDVNVKYNANSKIKCSIVEDEVIKKIDSSMKRFH